MVSTQEDFEEHLPFDAVFFQDRIHRIIEKIHPRFNAIVRWHILFHVFFLCAIFIEVALLFFFLSSIIHSTMLAYALGLIFFTVFSYFMLKLSFDAKKPEQLDKIEKIFVKEVKALIQYREAYPDHHLAIANACTLFGCDLEGKESTFYRLPKWLDFLDTSIEKFSVFCHRYDVLEMRERLFEMSKREHLRLVKIAPTDLEVHAGLANAYVALSSLYRQSKGEESQRKYRAAAECAIEEFKILHDFAPDDPWVHLQLAYSYHDLGMPEQEISEYEAILRICPDETDALYKLGVLYFQQGHNAKGLEVYEQLKEHHYKKAELLIAHYGDFR